MTQHNMSDIPFTSPAEVREGAVHSDRGKVHAYVLSFAGEGLEVTRLPDGKVALDDGKGVVEVSIPILDALGRLDLAGMVVQEPGEEE